MAEQKESRTKESRAESVSSPAPAAGAVFESQHIFTVSFDTQGGTTVESQKHMYGELVQAPAPPTREGYVFDGWYLDQNTTRPWDLEKDVITESLTLYAGWQQQ